MVVDIDIVSAIGALMFLGLVVALGVLAAGIIREWDRSRTKTREQQIRAEQVRIQTEAEQVSRQLAEQAFRVQRDMLRQATERDTRHG